jgi:predicted enzyme related to lactoylglutathione lyase
VNLDTIYFEVGDAAAVGRAVAFYVDHFGLEVSSAEEGESAWLRAGPLTLGFHVGDAPTNPWAFNLDFSVTDVDAEVSRLKAEGVEAAVGPYDAPWGRAASFVDPNGFTVWLTQR